MAFRGLSLDPYLTLSLRPSLFYLSQPSHTIACSTDRKEVEGQLRWKHRRIPDWWWWWGGCLCRNQQMHKPELNAKKMLAGMKV